MRLIDAEDAINQVAMIAKALAKSDKQKALCGRIIYMLEHRTTVKAIPIPDGATNGDMQKVMHPNAIIQINELGDMVHVKYDNHTCWVNYELDWWDAPCKSEVNK